MVEELQHYCSIWPVIVARRSLAYTRSTTYSEQQDFVCRGRWRPLSELPFYGQNEPFHQKQLIFFWKLSFNHVSDLGVDWHWLAPQTWVKLRRSSLSTGVRKFGSKVSLILPTSPRDLWNFLPFPSSSPTDSFEVRVNPAERQRSCQNPCRTRELIEVGRLQHCLGHPARRLISSLCWSRRVST